MVFQEVQYSSNEPGQNFHEISLEVYYALFRIHPDCVGRWKTGNAPILVGSIELGRSLEVPKRRTAKMAMPLNSYCTVKSQLKLLKRLQWDMLIIPKEGTATGLDPQQMARVFQPEPQEQQHREEARKDSLSLTGER